MKKGKLHVYYDEEGDVLEVILGKPTISYMKNLGNGTFERIDEKNGKTKGFLITSFKKRSEKKAIDITLPANLEILT